VPLVARRLAESNGPITAVTDFMSAVPDQIRQFLPRGGESNRTFTTLGTDGMGRSDTREALRRFFEIDTGHVVVGVLSGLLADGKVEASVVEDAISRYGIDADAIDPWNSFVD
jgi:pyruvate dehydrogenase E1 component